MAQESRVVYLLHMRGSFGVAFLQLGRFKVKGGVCLPLVSGDSTSRVFPHTRIWCLEGIPKQRKKLVDCV